MHAERTHDVGAVYGDSVDAQIELLRDLAIREACADVLQHFQLARRQPALAFADYARSGDRQPLFLLGDARKTLASFPPACIDCCMTSPPYWGQREGPGLGGEADPYYARVVVGLQFR